MSSNMFPDKLSIFQLLTVIESPRNDKNQQHLWQQGYSKVSNEVTVIAVPARLIILVLIACGAC